MNCKSALKWQSTQSWAFTHALLMVAFAKFTQWVSRNAMTNWWFERLAANCGQPRIDQDEYIKPQSVASIVPQFIIKDGKKRSAHPVNRKWQNKNNTAGDKRVQLKRRRCRQRFFFPSACSCDRRRVTALSEGAVTPGLSDSRGSCCRLEPTNIPPGRRFHLRLIDFKR